MRPLATFAALLAPALLIVVERASNLSVVDLGAIVGPVGDQWWRYLAAPFVYDDLGYLFACGLAIAIFLPGDRAPDRLLRVGDARPRLRRARDARRGRGSPPASATGSRSPPGGNGIALGVVAAWVVLRDAERRADPTDEYDRVAVAVVGDVLLLLPLVEDFADPWAGIVGGLIGACAAASRRRSAARTAGR